MMKTRTKTLLLGLLLGSALGSAWLAEAQITPANSVITVFTRRGNVVATSGDYSFSLISGNLATSQLSSIGADSLYLNATGGAAVPIEVAINDCHSASNALTYNTTTHAIGCNTISGGSLAYTATFSGNVSGTPSAVGLGLDLAAANFTDNNTAGSGTAAVFTAHSMETPVLLATNATVTTTHASTLSIANAPTASTNETITAKDALYITNGDLNMGTTGQQIQMFNVGTPGATNRESGSLLWTGNAFTLRTTKNGTGASRDINITATGAFSLDAPSNFFYVQGGVTKVTFNSTTMFGANASAASVIYGTAASATVPSFLPFRSATTSGLGGTSNVPTMIVSAVAIESWSSTGPKVSVIPTDATKTDSSVCRDTTTGDLYTGTGTLGICLGTSSARYKSGITDLNVGLAEILKLTPRMFFYKDASVGDPNKIMYGFIAEESTSLPMLVGYDDQGQPNTFDYMGVVPILVKAVQQQQAQILDLQARLTVLENKVGP